MRIGRGLSLIGDTTVYLHLDDLGSVLYVGMSKDVPLRNYQHSLTAQWWPRVSDVLTVGCWPRAIAAGVEVGLIKVYDPAGNAGREIAAPPHSVAVALHHIVSDTPGSPRMVCEHDGECRLESWWTETHLEKWTRNMSRDAYYERANQRAGVSR